MLLNSAVLRWFFPQVSAPFRGGWISANRQFLSLLPIPLANDIQQATVCRVVDYLLWLHRQPALADDPSENPRDPLMLGYFEHLLNGLVYELFFPDELHARKLFIFRYVKEARLPVLAEIPEANLLAILRETFERIYDLKHPIRGCLFSLGAIETGRIIEGKG